MAPKHTIMFTLMARSVSLKADTFPVSIYVSPRLYGAQLLGAFPDWLKWTRFLKEEGLDFEIQCGSIKKTIEVDREVLQPDLWEEIFNKDTLVRSYEFPDYSDRSIISYSMRQTLSALKATYQQAGVELALPDSKEQIFEKRQSNRYKLRELVKGLDVHWDGDNAPKWRAAVRVNKSTVDVTHGETQTDFQLDSEGLIVPQQIPPLNSIALPFAVFHHMPTPKYDENRDEKEDTLILDTENLLDFHQALSALNSYPELLRALGLVFDLELPPNLVQSTPLGKYETFWVSKVTPGWRWSIDPETPQLKTAYINMLVGERRLFCNAPHRLDDTTFPMEVIGLLKLEPNHFGLAQVDLDGGMHKAIILAETLNPSGNQNLDADALPQEAAHPEVFDPEATLPSLRSGGFSLYADQRGHQLLSTLLQAKAFNDSVASGTQQRPFFEEDLVRGYRLDVWDSPSNAWHSLHMRHGDYKIGDKTFNPENKTEEGFVQMAVTHPAKGSEPVTNDLYLHEAIARWAGWSLSAPMPSKHLSRYPDPKKAVPPDYDDPEFYENQPDTPFKISAKFTVTPNSLPRLRFGTRYRFRARAVDLSGNSLPIDDFFAERFSSDFALPNDPEGFAYLRFEPVGAPLVILRDTLAIVDPAGIVNLGSAIDRLVIRTFNDDISKDNDAADTTAADRHIVPPRTSVEMGDRLGMFDDASGRLDSSPAMWKLISEREAGEFKKIELKIKGHDPKDYPVESGDRIDSLPYLPDPLSRGAAIRDLPGTPSDTIGKVEPGTGTSSQIVYDPLNDPNPRTGSATLVSFGGADDWQKTVGFRLALTEPQANQSDLRPQWNPTERLLTVYMPKGQTEVVPLSSYMTAEDLKLMGVWKWLREYIEHITVTNPQQQYLFPGSEIDRIAHILQRVVEGGHWMLTPPRLLTFIHAVQQPLGRPEFTALNVDYTEPRYPSGVEPLQTAPTRGKTDPTAMAPITAWRRPDETSAYLLGSLLVHGASTAKVDIVASWDDPVDDVLQNTWSVDHKEATVDELPLPTLDENYLLASGAENRKVGYYDPEHDQIAFVRRGDWTGYKNPFSLIYDAAPRHLFNDTKHHVVNYTAVATSRFREYFKQDEDMDFTRSSEPVKVDVPASARPLAPDVAYVIPTFGWERQTDTNQKRSVRFGGGLRVYLHRPWFSSGVDELLGVALWSTSSMGVLDQAKRESFKPFFTQWGMDPIWKTQGLAGAPYCGNFPDRVEQDLGVSLEEGDRVDVVGFKPEFDASRGLWYADLTINLPPKVYMPFVRLALVRYQPHALADAMVSRVVLADFAQLTPDRSAMVTADPYHPRVLRVVVSGVAPSGPEMTVSGLKKRPTRVHVRVQRRPLGRGLRRVRSDLIWTDAPPNVASVNPDLGAHPELVLWAGTITFSETPKPGEFRLLITEAEYISGSTKGVVKPEFAPPNRIVYSEIFEIDSTLIGFA